VVIDSCSVDFEHPAIQAVLPASKRTHASWFAVRRIFPPWRRGMRHRCAARLGARSDRPSIGIHRRYRQEECLIVISLLDIAMTPPGAQDLDASVPNYR